MTTHPPVIQVSDEDLIASFAHALKQRSTAALAELAELQAARGEGDV